MHFYYVVQNVVSEVGGPGTIGRQELDLKNSWRIILYGYNSLTIFLYKTRAYNDRKRKLCQSAETRMEWNHEITVFKWIYLLRALAIWGSGFWHIS